MAKLFVVSLPALYDVRDDAVVTAVCKTRRIAERWIKTTHKQILADEIRQYNEDCRNNPHTKDSFVKPVLSEIATEWDYRIDAVPFLTK